MLCWTIGAFIFCGSTLTLYSPFKKPTENEEQQNILFNAIIISFFLMKTLRFFSTFLESKELETD
jgi:hypothetical protein